jgi:CheY-like chemotaxis protein
MKARLLIVDDEEVILSLLKTVLQSQGYSVTTAASGAEAKAMLAADEGFDLVITDMRMETETAGYEVVEVAVSRPTRPAIIIVTAFPLLAQQWRQAGADAVLTKPTRMPELLGLIASLLEKRGRR